MNTNASTAVTKDRLDRLSFRKEQTAARLHKLEGFLSGGSASLLPQVQDKGGRFSEEKAWALIDRLMKSFRTYQDQCYYPGMQAPPRALSQEEEQVYRAFLYCAIRYAQCPPTWDSGLFSGPEVSGTCGDLVLLARSLVREKPDLIYRELEMPVELDGFFAGMDLIYDQVSPTPISDAVSDEDHQRMALAHKEDLAAEEQTLHAAEDLDLSGWDPGEVPDPTEDELEDAYSYHIWQDEQKEEWTRQFTQAESFCRQYLLFREGFYQMERRDGFARDVEHMLDAFLLEEGRVRYLDDDRFYAALAVLERAESLLKRQLGKEG